jgi:hypothetical protein
MKTFKHSAKFIKCSWFCELFGISAITLLFWVLHIRDTVSETTRREENIHSWQQMCILVLTLGLVTPIYAMSIIFGFKFPWWLWISPIIMPFLLYVLMWLVEVALPPYDKAYVDTVFEREAKENADNPNYIPTFFSVWKYFKPLKNRQI